MVRVLALLAACSFALACGPKASEQTTVPGDAGACLDAQFMKEEGAAGICRSECADGNGESCAVLATMLERGHLVEPSHEEALELADRACGLGESIGCLYAGDYRTESDDLQGRAEGYAKACVSEEELGLDTREDRKRACFRAAHAYVNGIGVDADEDRGAEFAQAACAAGSMRACEKDFSAAPEFGPGQ